VLVATGLRKSIAGMLPMVGLFNHAVVEFQLEGRTVWVDPTVKRQGGGALHRVIPNFGFGLPVDKSPSTLVPAPRPPATGSVYELTETILLDTAGAASMLAVNLRVTGGYADGLRQHFATLGEEAFGNERLQDCARRFVNAARVRPLRHRDDRTVNEFLLAEVFQIDKFLSPHQDRGRCAFHLPASILFSVFQLPEPRPRAAPFALPYPCNIIHTIEVESQTLDSIAAPRFSAETKFARFSRRQKSLHRFWSTTLSLTTLAEAVPAAEVGDHRNFLEKIWKESAWSLFLPVGYAHPRARSDFGELPHARQRGPPTVATTPAAAAHGPAVQAPTPVVKARPSSRPAEGHRRGPRGGLRRKDWVWLAGAVVLALVITAVVYWLVLKPRR
jgi:hypothetical protein